VDGLGAGAPDWPGGQPARGAARVWSNDSKLEGYTGRGVALRVVHRYSSGAGARSRPLFASAAKSLLSISRIASGSLIPRIRHIETASSHAPNRFSRAANRSCPICIVSRSKTGMLASTALAAARFPERAERCVTTARSALTSMIKGCQTVTARLRRAALP
jgi:hypothetical protein